MMDTKGYRKSMSFAKEGSLGSVLAFTKQHKKSNSDNETAAELRALRDNSALKATKKNLISQKLKRFLVQRPTQEDLYQRNILTTAPYQTLPPKLSIFYKIQKAFETAQGSQAEGIFRVSGNSGNISKVWNSIAADSPNFQGVTPHDIAGVMKLYIRQLQIPLIPTELFQYFVDAQRIDDISQRIIGMKQLLRYIPEDNLLLLRALIIFLERVASNVAVNKMTPHNLAVCFGPNVLRSPKDGAEVLNDIEVQCSVVTTMISHRVELFGETNNSFREERSHTISHMPTNLIPLAVLQNNNNNNTNNEQPIPPPKPVSPLSNLPPPPPNPIASTSSPSLLSSLPPPPSLTTPPTLTPIPTTSNNNSNVVRKTLGTGKPPALPPPPPMSMPTDLPPPILSLPSDSLLPPLPPPPPLVPPKPKKKQPVVEEELDDQDEELYLALIDDLDETDKDTLAKKLAMYFSADPEGFRRFLKKAVGADGVIALLELLVL